MIKNRIKPSAGLIFLIISMLCGSQLAADQSAKAPLMDLDKTIHTFPASFEGEHLSHSFKLYNRGTADLEILDVTRA